MSKHNENVYQILSKWIQNTKKKLLYIPTGSTSYFIYSNKLYAVSKELKKHEQWCYSVDTVKLAVRLALMCYYKKWKAGKKQLKKTSPPHRQTWYKYLFKMSNVVFSVSYHKKGLFSTKLDVKTSHLAHLKLAANRWKDAYLGRHDSPASPMSACIWDIGSPSNCRSACFPSGKTCSRGSYSGRTWASWGLSGLWTGVKVWWTPALACSAFLAHDYRI